MAESSGSVQSVGVKGSSDHEEAANFVAKLRSEFVQLPSEKIIYEFQIFGFPTHYTDVGNLNNKDKQRLLGNAWSVAVV